MLQKMFSTSHCFVEYGTKLIHNNEGSHSDSFRINLESFKTFRNCLSHKLVTERELFLGGRRYSEAALKGQLISKANSTVFIWIKQIFYFCPEDILLPGFGPPHKGVCFFLKYDVLHIIYKYKFDWMKYSLPFYLN